MDKFDKDLDERTAKALGGALASSDPNRFMQDLLKFSFQILPLIRPGYLKEVPRQGFAEGGHVLEDDYPTHYLPGVGRQVMADGGTPMQYAPIDASMLVGRSSEPFRGGEEYTDAGGQKIAAPFVKGTSGGYPVYDFMQEPEPSKYSGNLPGDTNPFEPLMQWNWLSKLMGYAHGGKVRHGYATDGEVEGDVQFAPPEVEQAMKVAQEVTADSVPFGEEAKEPQQPKEYEPFSVLPFREDKEGIHFDPHAGLLGPITRGLKIANQAAPTWMGGQGHYDPNNPEDFKATQDLAGLAMTGSFGGTRPAGALASGASREEPKTLTSDLVRQIRQDPLVSNIFKRGEEGKKGAKAYIDKILESKGESLDDFMQNYHDYETPSDFISTYMTDYLEQHPAYEALEGSNFSRAYNEKNKINSTAFRKFLNASPLKSMGEDIPLMATRSISSGDLPKIENQGAFSMPSLAIKGVNYPADTGFGDTVLVAHPETALPSESTRVYGADVWTPMYPLELQNEKNVPIQRIFEEMQKQSPRRTLEEAEFDSPQELMRSLHPEYKTKEDIKANAHRLAEKDSFRDAVMLDVDQFADNVLKYRRENLPSLGKGYYSTYYPYITKILQDPSLVDEYFPKLPNSLRQQIAPLRSKINKIGTPYFESKVHRIVRPDEFGAALVPQDKPEAEQTLRRLGISDIHPYDTKDIRSQVEAYNKLKHLFFSDGGSVDDAVRLAHDTLSKRHGYATDGAVEDNIEGDVQFAPDDLQEPKKETPLPMMAQDAPKPKEYEPFGVLPFREDEAGIHFDPHAGLLGSIISGLTAPGDVVTGKLDPMSDEGIKRAMDLAGVATSGSTFGTRPAGALASGTSRPVNPLGMHSPGAEAARALPQEKGTPEQILGMLRKVVPEHEIEHSGIAQEIAGLPSVNKEDVAKHFESKLPQIKETVYGKDVKPIEEGSGHYDQLVEEEMDRLRDELDETEGYHGWSSREQENYEDTLEQQAVQNVHERIGQREVLPTKYSQYTLPEGEAYEEVVLHGSPKKDELVDSKTLEEARAAYIRDYINDEVNRALDEGILHQRNAQTVDQDLLNEITAAARVDALMELEQDPEGLASYLTDSGQAPVYRSGHYPEVNDYIAHYRKKMRTSPEGEKIFHLEELQSDRAQQGRKRGFATEDQNLKRDKLNAQIRSLMDQQGRLTNDLNANYAEYYRNNPTGPYLGRTLDRAAASGQGDLFNRIENLRDMQVTLENERDNLALSIPPAPYVMDTSHWTDLGLKHAIKKAVEAGADKFAWTPGEEQTKRYSLERTVGKLSWSPDTEELIVHSPNGALMKTMQAPKNKLSDLIGKEAAEKLVSAEPSATKGNVRYNVLEGDDLKIGGEGMRGYYDRIIPTRLKKILKKLDPDVKLETHNLVTREPNKYNWTGNDFLLREVSVIRNEANEKDLPVQLIRQMDDVRNEMRKGTSFKDAMEKHGSPAIAELFGGELVPRSETKSLPSFKITPKMRENVKKGLSAFRKGGTVEKALDIVRRGDAR